MVLSCKRHIKDGFFVVEIIVYVAIFGLCMTVFMRSIAYVIDTLHAVERTVTTSLSITTALDCIVRDIWCARHDGMVPVDSASFVILGANYDIGWQVDDETLYRIKGSYNLRERKWIKRKRNKVAQGIFRFSYTMSDNQCVVSLNDVNRVATSKNKEYV